MLTNKKLNHLMQAIVPANLLKLVRPEGDILLVKEPAINVICSKKSNFSLIAKSYSEENYHNVRALTVNWAALMNRAKHIIGFPQGKYTIFISEELEDAQQLAFVLLHEFGHVNWWLNNIESKEKDIWSHYENKGETYADFFAFDRLFDLYDLKPAMDAMNKYGSSEAWENNIKRKNVSGKDSGPLLR